MRKPKDIIAMVAELKAAGKDLVKRATDLEVEIRRVEGPAGPPRGQKLSEDDMERLGAMMMGRRNRRLKKIG